MTDFDHAAMRAELLAARAYCMLARHLLEGCTWDCECGYTWSGFGLLGIRNWKLDELQLRCRQAEHNAMLIVRGTAETRDLSTWGDR